MKRNLIQTIGAFLISGALGLAAYTSMGVYTVQSINNSGSGFASITKADGTLYTQSDYKGELVEYGVVILVGLALYLAGNRRKDFTSVSEDGLNS
jgi:hypothetical protein